MPERSGTGRRRSSGSPPACPRTSARDSRRCRIAAAESRSRCAGASSISVAAAQAPSRVAVRANIPSPSPRSVGAPRRVSSRPALARKSDDGTSVSSGAGRRWRWSMASMMRPLASRSFLSSSRTASAKILEGASDGARHCLAVARFGLAALPVAGELLADGGEPLEHGVRQLAVLRQIGAALPR